MRRTPLPAIVPLLIALAGSAHAADGPPGKPRVWAVVVGIDRYADRAIPACSTSARDARAVADWIARTAGWGREHVLFMDEGGVRRHGAPGDAVVNLLPTRENLDWALTGWLSHRARAGDVVVIYFAGQATVRPAKGRGLAGRGFLLPIDAAAADVDRTGWSLEDALDRSAVATKAKVVLWLDTSPRGRGADGLPASGKVPTGRDWLDALTRWPGVTAWLASERDRAPEAGPPGPFVAALTKGMGAPGRAHNLLGCLQSLRDDPALRARGFLAAGGIEAATSLWPSGIRPVEAAVPELIVQNGHGDRVTSVIVTADGGKLISAAEDSTIRVWGLADRALVRILADPMNGVSAMAMDRDGATLIAGDGMGRILGWDLTRDRPRSTFGPTEHADGIVALAFLPDGRRVVSLDRGRRSVMWEVAGGLIRKVREFDPSPLVRLARAGKPDLGGGVAIAAAGLDGTLQVFDAEGQPLRRIDGPGGHVSAMGVSDDGRRIAAGDDRGRVVVVDASTGAIAYDRAFEGTIRLAKFSPGGLLLVGDEKSLFLADPRPGAAPVPLLDPDGKAVPGEIERAEFSGDGSWLAACTGIDGRVLLWRASDPARPEAVAIGDDETVGIAPGFTPDGRALIVGDADGRIRSWALDDRAGKAIVEARPSIPPARGKVAALQAAPGGEALLEITRDDVALIWDLKGRRGARPLPGSWIAGAFVPGDSTLALAEHPDRGGSVVLVDRADGAPRPVRFDRPPAADGTPSTVAFGAVAVSRSGRHVAAASLESQSPLLCVWDRATGALEHWTRGHDGGLTAVDFSADEAFVLTASDDGTAKLWPLDGKEPELRQPLVFRNPRDGDPAITAARVCPTDPRRVLAGTRGGWVLLWDWDQGRGRATAVGKVEGSVNAVTFSADGSWLVASGARDKTMRFWSLPAAGDPREVRFDPAPHHVEQVGALAPWIDGSRIVSGGDDAAVRFWDLAKHSLIGTLVASGDAAGAFDWIAFTPDGLFDGSQPGEALVKWRVGERVVTLEQAQDSHYAFGLAETFAQAERPRPRQELHETPRLKFVAPPADRDPMARDVELTIWTGDRDLADLRLYQNGVPIRARGDFQVRPDRPNYATTRVRLRKGENRFYAMASKPGATDGRSDDLAVGFDGEEPPGRLHTIALGVSAYESRPLKYAHRDARDMADFLHNRSNDGDAGTGERIVLTDDKVNERSVLDAFVRITNAVRDHPEDTVVLFLAGHTDTDQASDQFCLLLPKFPFSPLPPEAGAEGGAIDLAIRGNPGVAIRGANAGGQEATRVGHPDVLAFVTLYNLLARVDALQRLVIVDACQAGAILNDPSIKRIQRVVETASRKSRNSYLLAARRGEPATEAEALRHGLLTYVLLRGMGADGLAEIPEEIGGFPGPDSADLNGNGQVSTAELISYADDTLPRLARIFPLVVSRAGGGAPDPLAPPPELEKGVRVQASDANFPLVPAPTRATAPR